MSQSSDFDHSTEEWEAQRELFTHYYVIEDKPLWEVKSIMENTYGFRATCGPITASSLHNLTIDNQRTAIQTTHRPLEPRQEHQRLRDESHAPPTGTAQERAGQAEYILYPRPSGGEQEARAIRASQGLERG
jgi:hypothetical protein